MKKDYTHIAVLLDRSGSMKNLKEYVINGYNRYIEENKSVNGNCTITLVQFDDSPFPDIGEEGYYFTRPPITMPLSWKTDSQHVVIGSQWIYDSKYTSGDGNKITTTVGGTLNSSPNITSNSYLDGYKIISENIDINEAEPLNDSTYVPRGMTAYLDALGKLIDDTGLWLSEISEEERPEKVIVVVYTDGLENASRKFNREDIRNKIRHQEEKYGWQFVFLGANMDAVSEAASLGIKRSSSLTYTANQSGVLSSWNALADSTVKYRSGQSKNMSFS